MKRPDLLLLIAIWEFVTAFVALIGISIIAIFVFPDAIKDVMGSAIPGIIFGLSIAILVLLCYIGLAIAGGVGILKGKEWGRVLSIVHAVLSLFWFPIGTTIGILITAIGILITAIGILIIVYLTRPEVTDYMKAGGGNQQP